MNVGALCQKTYAVLILYSSSLCLVARAWPQRTGIDWDGRLPPFYRKQAMPIRGYVEDHAAFDPEAIRIMSRVFEEVCSTLQIADTENRERAIIAARIIDLARSGVIDAEVLRERLLLEARSLPPDGGG